MPQLGGQRLAALPVGLTTARRPAEQPQPYVRELLAHQGEGADEGLQVLDRVDPARPAERQPLRFGPGGRELRRIHAVVDGPDRLRCRTTLLLPQPVVAVARRDQRRPAVGLLRQQPEEAQHHGLHRPAVGSGAVAEIALPQVDAVLGEQQRSAVTFQRRETGEHRDSAAHRVGHPVAGHRGGQWAQRVLQQSGGGQRVMQRRPGLPHHQTGAVPHRGQHRDRPVAAEKRAERSVRRGPRHRVQRGGETVLGTGVEQRGEKPLVGVGEPAPGASAGRLALRGCAPHRHGPDAGHLGGQLPYDGFMTGAGDGDDVELQVRHAAHELVAPDAHASVAVRIGAFGEQGDTRRVRASRAVVNVHPCAPRPRSGVVEPVPAARGRPGPRFGAPFRSPRALSFPAGRRCRAPGP